MNVLLHVYVWTACVLDAYRSENRVSDTLELKLQAV